MFVVEGDLTVKVQMPALFYIEIYFFCIAILIILLHKTLRSVNKRYQSRLFAVALISMIALFVSDCMWKMTMTGMFGGSHIAMYVFNVLYFVFSGISSYSWFLYSEAKQESSIASNRRVVKLCCIPVFVLAFFAVASVKTGWIFYITEDGEYERGSMHIVHILVSYGYLFVSLIKTFVVGLMAKSYEKKNTCMSLCAFIALPAIAAVLQIFIEGFPMLCMGVVFGALMHYIRTQEMLISIDPLTQCNNRNRLMKYLSGKMNNYGRDKELYLLMIDVDHFKSINDKYGHIEGDRALIKIGSILKKIGGKHECFICRYGGDEFVIAFETDNIYGVDALCRDIMDMMDAYNNADDCPYRITLSIGYAQYNESFKSIASFISAADKELYKSKAREKF